MRTIKSNRAAEYKMLNANRGHKANKTELQYNARNNAVCRTIVPPTAVSMACEYINAIASTTRCTVQGNPRRLDSNAYEIVVFGEKNCLQMFSAMAHELRWSFDR